MALIKCSECGKKISNKAKTCPNCGCPIGESSNLAQASPSIANSMASSKKKKGNGCLICIVCFLAVSAFAGFMISSGDATTKSESESVAEFTKDDAADIDSKVWENVEIAIKANNAIVENFDKAVSGQIVLVDYYDYCKETAKILGRNSIGFPKSDDEGAKIYIQSATQYVIQVQILANSIVKYIDKAETKNLSAVKSNIEQCTQLMGVVAQNRGVFLGTNGFTDDEIKALVEQISVE